MILVTGANGFVGKVLVRHLLENDHPVRALLRPAERSPSLPKSLPMEAALSSITNERGLRAAVAGVETIYHLVGLEWHGVQADLSMEIDGARTLLGAAEEAGVKRIVYLSHLGAERASAFPVLKAKGIVEELIRRSPIEHTIIRSGLVFGPGDHFTTSLAKLMAVYPFFFFLPSPGNTLLQPIWVEDLATILTWLLDKDDLIDQTVEVGGPEFLSIEEIARSVMERAGMRRWIVDLRPSTLRMIAVALEYLYPAFPHSVYWLDYLTNDRTCEIDSVSRLFGLLPERFHNHLDYLEGQRWGRMARQDLHR